tara:strand:- start:1230 stop:1580 length:351 start_codon:yes stop_codon:yes gene_type:complete
MAGMGILIGEATENSAIGQVRLTLTNRLVDNDVEGSPGLVEFSLAPSDGSSPPTRILAKAEAENDYIARVYWEDLSPGTQYRCETRIGSNENISPPAQPRPSKRFQAPRATPLSNS